MKTTSVHVKILSIIHPIVAIIIIVMMVVSYHINFKTQKSFFESCMQELSAKSAQESPLPSFRWHSTASAV